MKFDPLKVPYFVGQIEESETRVFKDKKGKTKTEIVAYGDYGTRMMVSLLDNLPAINKFLADLEQFDVDELKEVLQAEFYRQSIRLLQGWKLQLEYQDAVRKGEINFPDPDV